MKKILTSILAVIMLFSLCSVCAFAEEAAEEPGFNPYASPDDSTVRIVSYEEGTESIGVWLNKFDGADEDAACTGEAAAVFNAAAPVKAILFKVLWAGVSASDQDADLQLDVFAFDKDIASSCTGTPVFTKTNHYDDNKGIDNEEQAKDCIFAFDEPLPAGKYVIRFRQLGTKGTNEQYGRYIVLPKAEEGYPLTHLAFAGDRFGFMVDFVKTEGVEDYFAPLSEESSNYTLDKEEVITKRDTDLPHGIHDSYGGEFAILTPVIPEGKALYSLTITAAPTWENKEGNSNADIYVYKWKGDYDTSVEGRCLLELHKEGHKDNSDFVMEFDGKTLRYGNDNRYLIVIEVYEGPLGFWGCSELPEGWAFFGNAGDELDISAPLKCVYASVGDLGPEPTEAPTEVPTEKPTAAPTEEPVITEEPVKTEEAKPTATKAPEKTDEKKDSNILPIIIIAACALIIIACVSVVIVKKKKK